MISEESTHLSNRDRAALAFRITGAVAGLAIGVLAFAKSSWDSGWVVVLFAFVAVGGAVSYHVLTSAVRCPSCGNGLFNFRIGSEDAKRKIFSCRRCGATAWLAEGVLLAARLRRLTTLGTSMELTS